MPPRNDLDLNCWPRYFTPRNHDRPTLGSKMAKVAQALGTPFMPWQRYVADVVLELDPATGLLWYRGYTFLVPRQSGKTTWVLAKAVHRARGLAQLWGKQNIAYAAQTRNDARKKWEEDHVEALEASIYGREHSFKVQKANGREAIIWNNGSRHGITAVTEKSGHGPTLDEGLVDEAFAHQDFRLEQAYRPAMITRPSPQIGRMSTAGKSAVDSPYLWDLVVRGRARCDEGDHGRQAYFEWSAPEDADPADESVWWDTMPALGLTQPLEAVRAEFEDLPRDEFCRAYLNMWVPPKAAKVIHPELWEPLTASGGLLDPVTLAIDATPDHSWAWIVAVGDAAEDRSKRVGELIAHRPGTEWLVEELLRLISEHGPRGLWLDPVGPVGALLTELDSAGIAYEAVTTRQLAQACGGFLKDLREGRFLHVADPELDTSVYAGVRSKMGDAWKWNRSSSTDDIGGLVSLTLANFGASQPVDDDGGEDFADVF